MSEHQRKLLARAREALRIKSPLHLTSEEALGLARALAKLSLFSHAAAVLGATLGHISPADPLYIRMTQQCAVFTYKDTTQGVHERLSRALGMIEPLGLDTTTDQETLGIAGSIFRRRWEAGGRRDDLEQSAHFYTRGEALGLDRDSGYTAINAAFVLDLLARESSAMACVDDLRSRSAAIRERIAASLPSRIETETSADDAARWWSIATLVEALFALGRFDEAREWMGRVKLDRVDLWQREATARQLAAIARLHAAGPAGSAAAWEWLNQCMPQEAEGLRQSAAGKVGLALSGGGFRASLFHLGVLARLAEMDVLRHIEVLSCVSGGSIIGAYYFLAVRHMLQTRGDSEITREDYIAIVRHCIDCMVNGIRRNVRTRSLAGGLPNLRVLYDPQYTRTDRIAELYDEFFYSQAPGAPQGRRVLMRELNIVPKDSPDEDFIPDRHNWRRRNKVPTLVLNATALNTGHNWQFTPSWMGESRHHVNNEIDSNYHLRRMYYDEAPAKHQDLPLCRAVAASSCVPGLFPPVRLMSLYENKLVALVDGAIHDNQGIASLLAEDCTICLISDGAGHMPADDEPVLHFMGVAGRSMRIVQTRLREVQHRELTALVRGSMVRMCFLHLKKGLAGDAIPWIGCETRPLTSADEPEPDDQSLNTIYGVRKSIPPLLASMRTDLDSFSDLEAHALMYDGYRLADQYIPDVEGLPIQADAPRERWSFLDISTLMQGDAQTPRLEKHLRVGASRAGKLFKLSEKASWIARGVVIGTVALFLLLIVWAGFAYAWYRPLQIAGLIVSALLTLYILFLCIALVVRTVRLASFPGETGPPLAQLAIDLLVFTVGWIPARLHLAFTDPAFLRNGSVKDVPTPPR